MKDRIYQTLLDEGYSSKSANLVLDDLMLLSSPLDTFLEEWLLNRSISDYESNGYSISQLQRDRNMTYPAALLTMDWLIKEPEIAIRSLSRSK